MRTLTIFSCMFILFVSSCNSQCTNDHSIKQSGIEEKARADSANTLPDKNTISTDSIFMSANQSRIDIAKDSTITVVIHNNTDTQITTGLRYKIEFLNNGKWERCEFSEAIVTNLILAIIDAQTQKDFIIYLYPQYHRYEPGKYRIVKNVAYKDEEIEVFAYFEIS